MFVFLSKLLPILIYPLGLSCIFLIAALVSKHQSKFVKWMVILALLLLWLGSTEWVASILSRAIEWQYLPPRSLPESDVIIVLGGGTHPNLYPRQIVEVNSAGDRILYAGWLYHQGVAPHILLSGGTISWMGTSDSTPSTEMAMLLGLMGVPEDALWLETESRNTYENVQYSVDILEQEGVDRVILVTSALHMPRSVELFRALDIDVVPAPTDYSITQAGWERLWEPNLTTQIFNALPQVSNLSKTTSTLKEFFGLMVYRFRGWT